MAEKPVAEEFFYLDSDGNKQDAELHNAIINPVDFPIDEKIMGPIRARNRAKHVAQQQAKTRSLRWLRLKAKAAAHLAKGRNDLYRGEHEQPADQAETGRDGRGGTGRVRPPVAARSGDRQAGDEEPSERLAGQGAGDPERLRTLGWNEAEHPRHPPGTPEGGQFIGDGGGKVDPGKPDAAPAPPAEVAEKPPRSFTRESPNEAQRARGVVSIYRPTGKAAAEIAARQHKPLTFYEVGGDEGVKTFRNAISRAKASNKYGAAVTVYEADDYKGMRLFTSPDGMSGFALKGDDIVSLFKHNDEKGRGIGTTSLMLAAEQGGRRLDAFDTMLPGLYSGSGFKAVARLKWDESQKPDGWDKEVFKDYNNGEPDVVFMVRDPAHGKLYEKGDGRTVADYDEGTAEQLKSEPSIPGYNPGVRGRGSVEVETRRAEWVAASPIKTIDDVIAAAPIAQRHFAEAARKVAADLGVEFKDPGAKTVNAKGIERTEEKIAARKGLSARVTDTARGAFILSDPDQADDIIHKLGRTHEILADPWRTIPETLYTDRALLFRDRVTGLIGEVQITEPKMVAAKKIGHTLYEESRSLPARIGAPPDDVPNPRVLDLEEKQRAIYGPVLDGYKGTAWEIVDGRSRG